MSLMRTLDEKYKIPGRSLPEILSRFDGLVSRQQNVKGRKFRTELKDRKVSGEAITNCLVLYFLDLPAADQDVILDRYLPELQAMVNTDDDPANEGTAALDQAGADRKEGRRKNRSQAG